MASYEFFLASSLEKVFPNERPRALDISKELTGLIGDKVAIQLVYCAEDSSMGMPIQEFSVTVEGAPCEARLRNVKLIPGEFVCYSEHDSNYMRTEPGLFPDLLVPMDGKIKPIPKQFRSVWIDWDLKDVEPGTYTVKIAVKADKEIVFGNGEVIINPYVEEEGYEQEVKLTVVNAKLPEQTLIHTEWFHVDCLADYYNVEVFGEEHWEIVEKFIKFAGESCGINMLLTPIFTQPLDTVVGGERTTVQLVKIIKEEDKYTFDFVGLKRWCDLCKKYGVKYLEIAHFFTQWGAYATPKIMAKVNGKEERIFGWDIPSTSEEYRQFLVQFVPKLLAFLNQEGYGKEELRFHISDEPNEKHLDSYLSAKKQVADLLDGYIIMDALSSYTFYQKGIVDHPVPANDHIQKFIDNQVEDLWVYYCCVQGDKVPNRFFAMPSARNRIMGVLMYLFDIKGFLHWGYNFYNAQFSKEHIDPYRDTHASYGFPAGDPFLVYPGPNGEPYSSIRNEVQVEALQDMCALSLLEGLTSKDFVKTIILEGLSGEISFDNYPNDAGYLLDLRYHVNKEIEKHMGQ